MGSDNETINISSDSSSDESRDTSPFPSYLPPYCPPTNGTRTKEQARKLKHDINAPILKSLSTIKRISSSSKKKKKNFGESTSKLTEELPQALTQALCKALSSLKKIPVPQTQPSQLPSGSHRVMIGLVCPKVWEIASQSMGKNRTMPDSQSLKDALSKVAQDQKAKDSKNKGKRPME